jgi:N-acetylmuramoyl-L-alanine amidase
MKQKVALVWFFLVAVLCLGGGPAALGKTVVIDAGHGGHDRGGIAYQRFPEKVVTLDIAQRLRSRLRAAGYTTVMTRTDDTFIGLRERCATANAQGNAVFVSIHTNSDPRGHGIGIETYYFSRQSSRLAGAIHSEVLRASGTPNRRIRNRGFYVLRHNRLPAVLVEVGFLTNAIEGPKLYNSSSYREQIAGAIERGVQSAF